MRRDRHFGRQQRQRELEGGPSEPVGPTNWLLQLVAPVRLFAELAGRARAYASNGEEPMRLVLNYC